MKRVITIAILIVLSYVLQVGVFSHFKMAGIAPNIMLILVISFAAMRGRMEGMLIGFFCGLIMDVFGGDTIGFYALLLLVLGYLNGFFYQIFYANYSLLPLLLILGNNFIYNFAEYVFNFLLRNRTDFGFYFMKIIMPEVVYTFLVAIFLYNIYFGINHLLEKQEKRVTLMN